MCIADTLGNLYNAFNNNELAANINATCSYKAAYTLYQPILDSLNEAVKDAIHASMQTGNELVDSDDLIKSIQSFDSRFKDLQKAVYDNQQIHRLCTSQYQDYATLTCPLNKIGTWLHLNSPNPLCDDFSTIQKFYEDNLPPPLFDPNLSFDMQDSTVHVDLTNLKFTFNPTERFPLLSSIENLSFIQRALSRLFQLIREKRIQKFEQVLDIINNHDLSPLYSENQFQSDDNKLLARRILDLPANYTRSDLQKAYHKMVRLLHPDKFSGTRLENDHRAFIAVQAAYEFLKCIKTNKPVT